MKNNDYEYELNIEIDNRGETVYVDILTGPDGGLQVKLSDGQSIEIDTVAFAGDELIVAGFTTPTDIDINWFTSIKKRAANAGFNIRAMKLAYICPAKQLAGEYLLDPDNNLKHEVAADKSQYEIAYSQWFN